MKPRKMLGYALTLCVQFTLATAALAVGTGGTGLHAAFVRGVVAQGPGLSVNGTAFNATHAGVVLNGTIASPADVLPGMVASVNGAVSTDTTFGIAQRVSVGRVVRGAVQNVGTGGTGLSVGHLRIKWNAATVVAGVPSADVLGTGDTLDVYGVVDVDTQSVAATRIERIAPVSGVELRGVVTAVTDSALIIDGLAIDVSTATFAGFGGPIHAGDSAVVQASVAGSALIASRVSADVVNAPRDGDEAELEGSVIALLGNGRFQVDSVTVDASGAAIAGGILADVVVGSTVHVEGSIVGGVLVARAVEVGDVSENETQDVDGPITAYTSLASFVVDGRTVDASSARIIGGSAADLKAGARVKAFGSLKGSKLKASSVTVFRAASAAELIGVVSKVRRAGQFDVGASAVDARRASIAGGTLASLRVGSQVDVVGTWRRGTLVASTVTITP